MVDKCNSCGASKIPTPISKISFWEGDSFKSKFRWEAFKRQNIIFKNLFKVDFFSISYLAIIIFLIWSYNYDIDEYRDISENPCGFCAGAATFCSYNRNDFGIGNKFGDLNIVDDPILTGKIT